MFISKAYAQAVETSADVAANLPEAPSAMEAFAWNMGLVVLMVVLFYILMIKPQQRRIKEHGEMLQGLQKGDKVVTGGGLVGTIDKIKPGEQEVSIDLGNGLKVTALRSTIHAKTDVILKDKPANDAAKKDDKKNSKK
ncbi:MAG: preprotein translocase subunit YajC [Micavibrio sp.]|nr:preprotein translocase subunit YajC [Micavibrio sp.]|tara:strand:+ start:489 stop:902 length:414 start_codon:yes stop_codon:yes gene_type:complete